MEHTEMTTGRVRPLDCMAEGVALVREQYWLFVAVCALGIVLINIAPLGLLMGPMLCGIYLCFFRRMEGRRITFELLFEGFEHFAESLIATLVLIAASVVLLVPAVVIVFIAAFVGVTASAEESAGGLAASVVLFVVGGALLTLALAVGHFCVFVFSLIVDRGLAAIPAITTSVRAVYANFRGVTGVLLLAGALALAAMLLGFLPVFLVLPICFGATAAAHRRVFPGGCEDPPG